MSGHLQLGGFGVELAIKSLEYKAVDDSKVEGENTEDVSLEEGTDELQGILFGVLQKRKPHLSAELATFKAALLANEQRFEDLKVWHLKGKPAKSLTTELGFQASQRIVSAANPLQVTRDISQNLPTHAISLSRLKLNTTLKEELQSSVSQLVQSGQSALLLNGRMLDPATVEPYE